MPPEASEWVWPRQASGSHTVWAVWDGVRRVEYDPLRPDTLAEFLAAVVRMVQALQGLADGLAGRVVAQAELLTRRAQGEPVPPAGPEFAAWLARDVEARPDGSAVVAGRELTADEAARLAYHLLLAGRGK